MAPELMFYWTGVVVCLAVCVGFGATVIVAAVVAPFIALKKIKSNLWQWVFADMVIASGLTQNEIQWAISKGETPDGYDVVKMIAWVESIKLRKPIRKDLTKKR